MSELYNQLNAQLAEYVKSSNLELSAQQISQLVNYVLLMHKWNKAYNLTSVREPKQMMLKHVIDSIVVAPLLTQKCYIDVGTGPGLPGIPLAIMCPDKHFILLDSLGKRVRFMKQVAYELQLKNIDPVQSRVEDFVPTMTINGVISRAFASLKDMLHWCQHLVDSEGAFLALKGLVPNEEIKELDPKFKVVEIIKLDVPSLLGDRHIIKLQKI